MTHRILALWVGLFGLVTPVVMATDADQARILFVTAAVEDFEVDYYLWAAELAAARLPGDNNDVVEGGLAAALRQERENRGTVQGIVEVMIDVHRVFEKVFITCYDTKGRIVWKKKTEINFGGSEDAMARKMLERVLKKAEKKPECGA